MNRMEEYRQLQHELEEFPAALEGSVARAQENYSGGKTGQWKRPVKWAISFAAAFVFLVNVSGTFAVALSKIPLLKDLAEFVSFSQTLKMAVDNDYVQWIGLEQSQNGIDMRIEYIIVDQKQVNVFYTLTSDKGGAMEIEPGFADGQLEGYVLSHSNMGEADDFKQLVIDFMQTDVPASFVLNCNVYYVEETEGEPQSLEADLFEPAEPDISRQRDAAARFEFVLSFDPAQTAEIKTMNIGQELLLDGQKILLEKVEILPTHMRIYLKDDAENTAWLTGLALYVENEKGVRFDAVNSGITASGGEESKSMLVYRLESPYFYESKSLTLYITEAVWLEKDMERILVDINNLHADRLPEGVLFHDTQRQEGHIKLSFLAPVGQNGGYYQIFDTSYYDEFGNEYGFSTWASTTYEQGEGPERFMVQFALYDYPHDKVYLTPSYSHKTIFYPPEIITIK